MAKSDRTKEDIRRDLVAERARVAEALGRLDNEVEDILSDLRVQARNTGRKAAMVAPAVVAAFAAYGVRRRRRRRRRASEAAED